MLANGQILCPSSPTISVDGQACILCGIRLRAKISVITWGPFCALPNVMTNHSEFHFFPWYIQMLPFLLLVSVTRGRLSTYGPLLMHAITPRRDG